MPTATVQRIHPHSQVRSVDREKLEVDIIASTDKIDSYNSTIDPLGWDLERFRRNPQILWAHDDRGYTPSAGLPVANAIPSSIRVEGNKLLMRLRFTPKETSPFGYSVFRLIADGFLHGLSVGFEPIEEVVEDDEDGNRITKYKRQRLLEVSVVTIPANDDALVVRARSLNREGDVETIKRMAEDVERMAHDQEQEKRFSNEEIEKWRGYFEQKQPVNKLASGVLKEFFTKVIGEEPPADEKEAWTRMGEAVEAMEEAKPETPEEEVTPPDTAPDEVPEEKPEEVKEEETPQGAAPETPSNPTPVEAPQEVQKASVLIPLDALASLPQRMRDTISASAEEALRQGIVPSNDLGGFIDRVAEKLALSVTSQ